MPYIFFIAGLFLFFRREIHFSKKFILRGTTARALAILYMLPLLVGVGGLLLLSSESAYIPYVALSVNILTVAAFVGTLYIAFFDRTIVF